MERSATIDDVVRTIVSRIHPRKIYLFGSQARGEATSNSDIDLVVVADLPGTRRERNRQVRRLFRGRTFDLDVFVLHPEEFERQQRLLSSIGYTAAKEGVMLYERA